MPKTTEQLLAQIKEMQRALSAKILELAQILNAKY
jgi:hypothetical protein